MNERTGEITTRSELSRDTAAQVSFTVEARDVRAVNPPPIQQTATGRAVLTVSNQLRNPIPRHMKFCFSVKILQCGRNYITAGFM